MMMVQKQTRKILSMKTLGEIKQQQQQQQQQQKKKKLINLINQNNH